MKKIIRLFIFCIFSFIMMSINGYALSGNLSSSKGTTNPGNKVTIYYTINHTSPIFSIEGTLTCKGSGINKSLSLNYDDMSNSLKKKSYSLSVNPTSTGTISCSASNVKVLDYNTGKWNNLSNKSISIKVNANSSGSSSNNSIQKNNDNKNLSSDNNLKSLSVSNGVLSPEFKKDVTEYKVEVENEVEKIKINATANNKEATIKGTGEKQLKVGKNSYGVVVIAENGKTKTYTIIVTRKEENPVYVEIDQAKYQVVRSLKEIEIPKNFKETKITIQKEEVPALYDSMTKFTLIALKDENNNIKLYICDIDKGTYTLFQEEQFTLARVFIMDMPTSKIPNEYKEYKQYINGNEYSVYKLKKSSDYALFYALNLDTGIKNLYIYDQEENTIQRYTDEYSKKIEENYNHLFYLTIALCGVLVLLILLLFILLMKKSKRKKKNGKEKK